MWLVFILFADAKSFAQFCFIDEVVLSNENWLIAYELKGKINCRGLLEVDNLKRLEFIGSNYVFARAYDNLLRDNVRITENGVEIKVKYVISGK